VAVVTEFGRTARINGSEGTDHGTGTIALLAGGVERKSEQSPCSFSPRQIIPGSDKS
jgi:Protein of unknown function (DUF1501)